jgi:transaldolase
MKVEGCRILFASTGVKDDSLPPYYYVEKLLAYDSINTAPVDTIKAFHAEGAKERALPIATQTIDNHFGKIRDLGIDFDALLDKQISEGLKSFKDAFSEILESL